MSAGGRHHLDPVPGRGAHLGARRAAVLGARRRLVPRGAQPLDGRVVVPSATARCPSGGIAGASLYIRWICMPSRSTQRARSASAAGGSTSANPSSAQNATSASASSRRNLERRRAGSPAPPVLGVDLLLRGRAARERQLAGLEVVQVLAQDRRGATGVQHRAVARDDVLGRSMSGRRRSSVATVGRARAALADPRDLDRREVVAADEDASPTGPRSPCPRGRAPRSGAARARRRRSRAFPGPAAPGPARAQRAGRST